MNAFIAFFICAFGAFLLRGLKRAYFDVPIKELKRHSDRSKPAYKKLLMVAKYDLTARIFLGSIEFFLAAAAVIVAGRTFDPFIALLVLAALAGLLKTAGSKDLAFIKKLALKLAPYFAKSLYYIDPLVQGVKDIVPSKSRPCSTTSLYEIEDLQDLIKLQQKAPNNRIPQSELLAALNSLEFGSKKIKEHMIPRDKIHFVSSKDPIGPILLSELHKSGFNCFPVNGNSENEVAGILYLEDIIKRTEGGLVGQAMDPKVYYLHEDKPLEEVLQAFSKTGRHEFVVLNSEARITGMVALKEVLKQMLSQTAGSGFDDYDDPSAVAGSS